MNNLVEKLIESFSRFPGIGKKTAQRFVFYLSKMSKEELNRLIADLNEVTKIKICRNCFFPIFENAGVAEENLCKYCSDKNRNGNLICVVEKESDLLAIENTRRYKGVYHILGGTLLSFSEAENKNLKIKELVARVNELKKKTGDIEIILALRPDTAGDATSLYLEKTFRPLNIKTTRLARGLPIGADLEYADEITLSEALIKRN